VFGGHLSQTTPSRHASHNSGGQIRYEHYSLNQGPFGLIFLGQG
jgi:hypothetical protein